MFLDRVVYIEFIFMLLDLYNIQPNIIHTEKTT